MAYNLFERKPLMETPKLTQPTQAYDPTKPVSENMAGEGSPTARQITAAYRTPQAQLQQRDTKQPQFTPTAPLPSIDRDDPASGMDALAQMYTSPEQEEKIRRSSVANQRILAVADALRHIGNIYNTSRYAPSQKFTSPVSDERTRYQQGKALRDAANYRYLSYQQARAAQDAKNRQWEATFNYNAARDAAKLNAQQEYWKNTLDERKRAADMANALGIRKADDAFKLGQERNRETERSHRVNEGLRRRQVGIAASNLALNREKFDWRRTNGGGGRGSNPYTYPTMNGYITLGRDLNTNRVGKKALFGELKKKGIIDNVWERDYDSTYIDPSQKEAMLNTAISQWLMNDPTASSYMEKHFGAQYHGTPYTATTPQPTTATVGYVAPWQGGQATPAFAGSQPVDDDEWTEEDEMLYGY
jgi:hypothetical protein